LASRNIFFSREISFNKIVNFDLPKAGDYTTVSLYTYDYSHIPIYTLKELLNNVIDGYTLYSDIFPDFKVIYSSTDDIIFYSRAGYIMIGQYEGPELGNKWNLILVL
jgi:hypothetical protein